MKEKYNYKDRIVVDQNIHFGKPCIKGTRITVENVLELLHDNVTFEQILKDYYSDLTIEDIKVCIEYAIDIVSAEEIHIKAV